MAGGRERGELRIVRTSRAARVRRVLLVAVGNRRALVGLVLVLLMASMSLLAPLISPYDPFVADHGPQFAPPGSAHWFGTDNFGRDVFTRVLWGGRKALLTPILHGLVGCQVPGARCQGQWSLVSVGGRC